MEEIVSKPTACCLLDEFSYFCFLPEFEQLVPIDPSNWYQVLKEKKFDFFLCETVWDAYGSGYDIGNIPKQLKKKRYNEIKRLNNYFKSIGTPTLFWNKEDNKHYYNFRSFANLFDYVLTTDSRTLKNYRKDCPDIKKVDVMVFAAQPYLHNPIHEDNVPLSFEGDIFFAGKWYHFPERRKELEELLALPPKINLHIYDRSFKGKAPSRFPKQFHKRVRKGLSYQDVVKKYKRYPIMLNVNSVKGSPTMFARRVPEAIACGISVLSSPSKSLEAFFGSNIYFVRDRRQATNQILNLLRQNGARRQNNHNARRKVLQKHTYFNRIQQICRFLSIPIPQRRTGVAILRVVTSPEQGQKLYMQMLKQTYPEILVNIPLLLTNVDETVNILTDLFLRKMKNKQLDTLGFIAVVYPGNDYGVDYILDNILSYQYLPDTKVIGKASIYRRKGTFLEHLYPELEQSFTQFLHPHTLVYSLAGSTQTRKKTLNYLRHMLGDESVDKPKLTSYSVDSYSFISGV